jgi:hypothetical protein
VPPQKIDTFDGKTQFRHQALRLEATPPARAVANREMGVGDMNGNYLGSRLEAATDSFAWAYVAIALVAALLAVLTLLLPRERAPSREDIAQVNAAQCG